jgi:hypothetical protein
MFSELWGRRGSRLERTAAAKIGGPTGRENIMILAKKPQAWNIFEVGDVQGPQFGVVTQGAGGDFKIGFATSWPANGAVEQGGDGGFLGTERDRGGAGKKIFLSREFRLKARSTKPFKQSQRGKQDPLAPVESAPHQGAGMLWPSQTIDQQRRIEKDHSALFGGRPASTSASCGSDFLNFAIHLCLRALRGKCKVSVEHSQHL